MNNVESFIGKWTLNPEKSQYDLGTPPKSGTYEIIEQDGLLTFKMSWVDASDEKRFMEYTERCDGQFHKYPVKEIADEMRLTLTSPTILESESRKNGKLVMGAKRELLSKDTLQVTMSGLLPDGSVFQNQATYTKTPP